MARVLIVGCGDLGSAIALHLHSAQHEVIGLRISQQKLPHGMKTIQADVTQPNTLTSLKYLNPAIIIYCVAASAQTDENYHAHYVQGLKNVLATQVGNAHLQHLFFVSSSRVYGQNTHHILDEDSEAFPNDFGGARLLEAEKLLNQLPCQSTVLRLSGIYGPGRHYLIHTAKDFSRWPLSNSWSNRIHRDDAAGFIAFLVQKHLSQQPLESCYIVTDDIPTLQYTVLIWIAARLGIDTSHIQTPVASGGKRLSNKRLRATGFQLQFPDYQIGYQKVLETI